jgi:hypothetical protein
MIKLKDILNEAKISFDSKMNTVQKKELAWMIKNRKAVRNLEFDDKTKEVRGIWGPTYDVTHFRIPTDGKRTI